jgi:AcrR family transcriptional regulator
MSPRAGLSRGVVVEAASLADEKGLEAATLTDLASELGRRTPSLYNHVAGLEGLRRELALLGVRELGQRLSRAAAGKAADEGIFGLGQAYRTFVKERPGYTRPPSGPTGSRTPTIPNSAKPRLRRSNRCWPSLPPTGSPARRPSTPRGAYGVWPTGLPRWRWRAGSA